MSLSKVELPLADDTNAIAESSKIALRLPSFWSNNPVLYFKQIEASFKLSNITTEETKYCSLIASLDESTMTVIADLVQDPDPKLPYSKVKERLIKEFDLTQTKRIKTLLQDVTLADSKPSSLLRRMRDLAGNNFSDSVLKEIWLSQLPQNMQTILSVSNEELPILAELADKVFDVTNSSPVCSEVQSDPLKQQVHRISEELSDLKISVSNLEKKVDKLLSAKCSSFQRSRSRSWSRQKEAKSPKSDLCWYHEKFNDKANKCVPPCSYSKN